MITKNFTKTILNGLMNWINSNFISHNKQTLSVVKQQQAKTNIGIIEATDDDMIALMQEVDAFPVVMDENGAIMTDEDGSILLI